MARWSYSCLNWLVRISLRLLLPVGRSLLLFHVAASVPCGGGGVAVAAAAPAAGGGAAPQSEAKKEEKVEEKEESDDVRYIALCLSSWYPVDQHEFLRIACSSILFALYTAVVFLLGFLYTRSNHVMKLEWYILVSVFIYR